MGRYSFFTVSDELGSVFRRSVPNVGVEQEAVCMSYGHTLERARDHARSSHLNKLHEMEKNRNYQLQ